MKLANVVSRITELPKILEQHGVASEDVIRVEYSSSSAANADILVQLYSCESIKKLGAYDIENKKGYEGEDWRQYKVIKCGISFICWQRESEAIA
ncbi:hypothetical protein [Lysinibacillus sp. Ag94]|uniref:hypothetical protein n=1 Tax=Lysinibacillus sp. Ag94 TaxID=2936682 RepID=UPI00200F6D3E|nr:hypothetical protein [Lysinibacillus sp. Ag94]UPW82359.1 hypothetical protein MY533_16630 [Lysinibacillus sp. Ag94]